LEDLRVDIDTASKRCAELGNSTRLTIFRLLVRAGRAGLPVGEIQKALDIPGSTLSHHINRLVQVGLLHQRRQSRTLYCEPQMEAIAELAQYLLSECCTLKREFN
jgi:ArsR family transcriptional regulator